MKKHQVVASGGRQEDDHPGRSLGLSRSITILTSLVSVFFCEVTIATMGRGRGMGVVRNRQ